MSEVAETLAAIHARMTQTLEAAGGRLAGIFYCPHRPEDGCACRKPLPGLLQQIAERFGVILAGVPCIGDSRRDLEAAWQVGARAILVRTGNGAQTQQGLEAGAAVEVFPDLAAAARQLVEERVES